MANKITRTNLQSKSYVNSLSRYINSQVIYYGDNNILTYTTYQKSNTSPSSSDKYAVIPPGMEYRPDLVSKKNYGTCDLWWKIMEANNIKDIYDFKAGLTIRLPNTIF